MNYTKDAPPTEEVICICSLTAVQPKGNCPQLIINDFILIHCTLKATSHRLMRHLSHHLLANFFYRTLSSSTRFVARRMMRRLRDETKSSRVLAGNKYGINQPTDQPTNNHACVRASSLRPSSAVFQRPRAPYTPSSLMVRVRTLKDYETI